ncbi:MAG TPA: recombinase family protein [Gemmatimonadaceae bacterium]|nr:recombinase family protein [Gemmatimonadaceae bacterium]
MRTACYARFSSDLQRQTSLEDQIRGCDEFAGRQAWQWQPEQIYTDAATSGASIDGRTGLQALLTAAAAKRRPFDVLLVDDSSRVARDLPDALRVLQRLKFAGVRVIYITQGIDSASEQAETLVAVHGLVDGLYLREMAAKIRRGLVGQLERGFSTGGMAFGYRAIPVSDPSGRLDPNGHPALLGKRLEIDEAEAPIVRSIFEVYAAGMGVPGIVRKLNEEGIKGRRGAAWKFGSVSRLLANERFTGVQIWGQRRFERRPGTNQTVARPVDRGEWRIVQRPDLRIVNDELWRTVQQRRSVVAGVARQAGSGLMRGRNAKLHSRHLFSGFLRCGTCGGAVTVVSGGYGSSRYGCPRHSKNGDAACTNRLTIRAKVADQVLLAGLQAALLRPETVNYIAEQLATALQELSDARPQQRVEMERAKGAAEQKLRHLVAAIEAGAGAPTVFAAIKEREAEIEALARQLGAAEEPLGNRLAVIPTWVRVQLEDAAALLSETPDRAKAEFARLGIKFTLRPVLDEGPRPFLRAEGDGNFEHLAFAQYSHLTTTNRSDPRSEP